MGLGNQANLPGFEPAGPTPRENGGHSARDTRRSGRTEDAVVAGHEPDLAGPEATHGSAQDFNLERQSHLQGFEPTGPVSHDGADHPGSAVQQDAQASDAGVDPEEPGAAGTGTAPDAGRGAGGEGGNGPGETIGMDWADDRRLIAMATPGWQYPISHLVFQFRQMTGPEFLPFVADIGKNGLLCPITRWRGEIIDGVHRLLACLEAGVEPRFEDLDSDAGPESHIWSKNDERRHLTFGERAEAAARRSARSKRGRRWPPVAADDNSANLRNKETGAMTQSDAASLFNVSPRPVSHGVRLFPEGSPATNQLRQAVRENRIALSDASEVAQEPPEAQRRALELVASGEAKTAVEGVRKARTDPAGRRRPKDTQVYSPVYSGENISICNSKVSDLERAVKPGTVDVIICCPPRAVSSTTLSHLAVFASYALTQEGLLIVAAETGRLPVMLDRLRRGDQEWIMEFSLLFPARIAESEDPHHIEIRRVALLVFGKSGALLPKGEDVIELGSTDGDPGGRRWSLEHGMALAVSRFASPGQVVGIPLLHGMGPAALATVRAGCALIGADEDQSIIDGVARLLPASTDGASPDELESE